VRFILNPYSLPRLTSMHHSATNHQSTALALAVGVSLAFMLWLAQAASAHGDEDHGKKPAQAANPLAQKPRTAERNVPTSQGQFRVRLRQAPADPRDGEEAQFEATITERVEGGFAGGDQPVADAKVTARITQADGKTVVASNLSAHKESEEGVYGLHYVFRERGDYKVIFVARTSDNRQLEADFPIAVTAAPVNWIFWGVLASLALLVCVLIAGSYFALKHRGIAAGVAARRTVPLAVGVFVFFAVGVAALAYFAPPRERRSSVAMAAGGEGEDAHSAAGDAGLGGSGAVLTIAKESQLMFGIRTAPVAEQKIVTGLKVTGAVIVPPNAKAKISPPVAGRITLDARLTVGSPVARGQRIGTIEQILSAPEIAGLEAQRATLDSQELQQLTTVQQARTRLNATRIELERARNLVEIGAVPKKRLQEAETSYTLAAQEVAAAEAQAQLLGAAAKQVAPTRAYPLLAPVAGVISKLNVATGQQVESGIELAEVTALDRVWLQAAVFEKDLAAVRGAPRASFVVTGQPDEVFQIDGSRNRLVTIGTTVDPQTRTVPVFYEVTNQGGRFREGMFAEITIDTSGRQTVLAVPKQAVITEQGKTFVFVFKGGESFEKRAIVLGAEGQEFHEIKSGLEAGERIVIEGIYQLRSTQPGA
jgi:membrane fusion protein, heavy metal efflux system